MSYPHLTAHPALPVPNASARSLQPAVLTLVLLSAIPTLITIAAGVAVLGFAMAVQPEGEDGYMMLFPILAVVALGLIAAAALLSGLLGGAFLSGLRRVAWYAAMPGAVQGLLAFLAGGLTGVPIMIAVN